MRKLAIAGLIAAALIGAGLGAAQAATATPTMPEVQAVSYDLAHEDTSDTTCWWEKLDTEPELLCGSRGLRPADSVDADQLVAAEAIAQRIAAGQPVREDWTWTAAPAVVGRYNDALLEAWEADGEPEAVVWLDSYAQPGKELAAELISERLDSGQAVAEDWTWVGMPAVVGSFNDALLGEWDAAGQPEASGWLGSYPLV